jgi:hypothetical protein
MDAQTHIVVARLIVLFCVSHARGAVPAQLVFFARDTRLVSVSGCETGAFSDWARLIIR